MPRTRSFLAAGVTLLAALAASCASSLPTPEAVIVETDKGPVLGETMEDGSVAFFSIPLAKSTAGDRRWRAPEPVDPWGDAYDARPIPPACAQADVGWNAGDRNHMSEDCLYITLRTPDVTPDEPQPVIVYLFGGANVSNRASWVGNGNLHQQGLVVVALPQRLGVFGYLSHPSLSAEQGGASGNYALMDEQLGLRWVRDNISRFGGDPARVTLIGPSSGGQHVGLHQQAAGSQGLFHRAVQISGAVNFSFKARTLSEAEAMGADLAARAGLRAPVSAAALRALPADDLLTAQQALPVTVPPDWALYMPPTIDGRVLTEAPDAVMADGRGFPVPLMFISAAMEEVVGAPLTLLRSEYGASAAGANLEEAIALYGLSGAAPSFNDPRLGDVAMRVSSDLVYRCPQVTTLRAASASGQRAFAAMADYDNAQGEVSHISTDPFLHGFETLQHGP